MRRAMLVAITLSAAWVTAVSAQDVVRYVRYRASNGAVSYGVLDDQNVRRVDGDIFGQHRVTDEVVPVAQVRLLAPVTPSKVIAVGLNYRSHLGNRPPSAEPGLFAKYPTSIVGPGDSIIAPPDMNRAATNR